MTGWRAPRAEPILRVRAHSSDERGRSALPLGDLMRPLAIAAAILAFHSELTQAAPLIPDAVEPSAGCLNYAAGAGRYRAPGALIGLWRPAPQLHR